MVHVQATEHVGPSGRSVPVGDHLDKTNGVKIGEIISFVRSAFGAADAFEDVSDDINEKMEAAKLQELKKELYQRPECGGTVLSLHNLEEPFLLQCLRTYSYDIALAAQTASNFTSFRNKTGWGAHINFVDVRSALHTGMHWLLPTTDCHGRRVLFYNARYLDPSICCIEEYQRMGCFLMQEATRSVKTQQKGMVFVVDMSSASISILTRFSLADIQRGVNMWREAFPCKLKQVYLYNVPFALRGLVTSVKMLLSKKIRDRCIVVPKRAGSNDRSTNPLLELLPAEKLPDTVGGSFTDFQAFWQQLIEKTANDESVPFTLHDR